MPEKKNGNHLGFYTRSVPITVNKETRTIRAVIASEEPVMVIDSQRWEPIMEVLRMDGCVMPDSKQVPLLDNHGRFGGVAETMRGSVRGLTVNGDCMEGDVHFSEMAQDEWTLARDGDLTDLSAGYQTYSSASTTIPPGESAVVKGKEYRNDFDLPMVIRTKWKIREASITPIGADETSKFRDAPNADMLATVSALVDKVLENQRKQTPQKGAENMPDEKIVPPVADATRTDKPEVDIAAIRAKAEADALEAANARHAEIVDTCRSLNLPTEFETEMLRSKDSVDIIRKKAIEKAKEALTPHQIQFGTDEKDNMRTGAVDALCIRNGLSIDPKKADAVRQSKYNGITIQGACREILALNGERSSHLLSNAEVASKILALSARQSAQGTGDFLYILANVANKFLQKGYQEAPTTYQAWTGKRTLNDFKQASIVNLSGFSDLDLMPEGSKFNMGKFSEKQETAKLANYGKGFSYTWQMIVNDDTSAFAMIPTRMGDAAARKIETLVYDTLTGSGGVGPTMSEDSTAMFTTTHGNLASTSASPSTVSLSAARAAMRKIKMLAPDGSSKQAYTNAEIAFWLVPPELETIMNQLIASEYAPVTYETVAGKVTGQQLVNTFRNVGQVIVSPYVGVYQGTALASPQTVWYAIANPNQVGSITVFKLAGYETPMFRSEQSQVLESLGVNMDIHFPVVVAAEDWRGALKNAGA